MIDMRQTENKKFIDLSAMTLFDAARTILYLSTIQACSNGDKKFKCKVASSEVINFISELPKASYVELV